MGMAGSNSMFSTQDDERETLILMQMRAAPHTDPSPALLLLFLPKALLFNIIRVLHQVLPLLNHYIHTSHP